MKLKIMQSGEPVLRQRAAPLSESDIRGDYIQRLIALMRDTMRDAPGVGLAAPQIGESLQLAVIEDPEQALRGFDAEVLAERERRPVSFHVIINPDISITDPDPRLFFEGCLSVSGFTGLVARAHAVKVECLNEKGEPRLIEASGWYARILQHEIDHLRGKLCIDCMEQRSFMTSDNYFRYWCDKPIARVCEELGIIGTIDADR